MRAQPATAAPVVLVADDDADLVMLIERRLVRDGYRVVTASDGIEAIDRALQHIPDLAVLDVTMPKLSGVEVMERLRGHPATQSIRIVLMSAGFQENGPTAGTPPGADDYIKKPFGPKELPTRVRAVLDRTPEVRAPALAPVLPT
jgi:DNA-binding response OmpR family regulator